MNKWQQKHQLSLPKILSVANNYPGIDGNIFLRCNFMEDWWAFNKRLEWMAVTREGRGLDWALPRSHPLRILSSCKKSAQQEKSDQLDCPLMPLQLHVAHSSPVTAIHRMTVVAGLLGQMGNCPTNFFLPSASHHLPDFLLTSSPGHSGIKPEAGWLL